VPNAKQTAAMVAAPAIALAPKRTAHGFAKAPSFAKASGGEPIGRTETGWVDAIFSIELVGLTLRSSEVYHSPVVKYSWIDLAARLPAPMARITVALPVTMSPPANTPLQDVRWVMGSAWM